jgi:dTDP-4-dehydrorhamnose reductase
MADSVLLVGGDSEIGAATAAHLACRGYGVMATTRRRDRVAADRPFLDLAMPLEAWHPPQHTAAACILAAVSRLSDCAADPAGSALINVTRTVALAEALLARAIPVLFLSTDKVFDGTRPGVPADAPTCPASEYGRQKAAAEAALCRRRAAGAPVAVLRLAKVVAPGMALLRQWKSALAAGAPVRAFGDMTLAPVPIAIVATAIERLIAARAGGIFQLSGPCDVSYTDLGRHLAQRLGADAALVSAVSAASAGLPPGATPANTTLDSTALREGFGIAVPDAWDVVDALIETC